MKLVIAIVSDEDGDKLLEGLNSEGFTATKLCSTGGFLRAGNTTVIIGVQKEKVDDVMTIIKANCKGKTKFIHPGSAAGSFPLHNISIPVETKIGGATVFVVDVERFEKY